MLYNTSFITTSEFKKSAKIFRVAKMIAEVQILLRTIPVDAALYRAEQDGEKTSNV